MVFLIVEFAATMPSVCRAVNVKLEEKMNKYGYSLLEPRKHIASEYLRPFLVPDLTDEKF